MYVPALDLAETYKFKKKTKKHYCYPATSSTEESEVLNDCYIKLSSCWQIQN